MLAMQIKTMMMVVDFIVSSFAVIEIVVSCSSILESGRGNQWVGIFFQKILGRILCASNRALNAWFSWYPRPCVIVFYYPFMAEPTCQRFFEPSQGSRLVACFGSEVGQGILVVLPFHLLVLLRFRLRKNGWPPRRGLGTWPVCPYFVQSRH